MKINIIGNILAAFAVSMAAYMIFGDTTHTNIILGFIFTFAVLCILDLKNKGGIKPSAMTKEMDEILHPVTENVQILHICNIQKLFGKAYNKNFVETCTCGSNLFRIYKEDTDKGTYFQFICVKCNQKATGVEFNWK